MEFTEQSCGEFVAALASKQPVPGGGGAAALAGAMGAALAGMVGSLTLGKKKYAAVEEEVNALKTQSEALQTELLALVEKDARAFAPLARAYGLPAGTDTEKAEKVAVMEAALAEAAGPPLEIMERCCAAITLHGALERVGAALAISDVGCGVALCVAALQAASLNVYINTKAMQNRARAAELNRQAGALLEEYIPKAGELYGRVAARLV